MTAIREVVFDTNIIDITSIKKAAYRFIDKFSAEFLLDGSTLKTVLRFADSLSQSAIDAAVDDFRKEALDQDLRASIKAETEAVRNLILAHAFSKTTLIPNG